jgi:hypothetical protein
MSKHLFYFKAHISKYVLENGGVPLNPFMLFDYFLLDSIARNTIREANNTTVERADELWVFGPVADGVLAEIILARQQGKPIKYFQIQHSRDILPISKEKVEMEADVAHLRDAL